MSSKVTVAYCPGSPHNGRTAIMGRLRRKRILFGIVLFLLSLCFLIKLAVPGQTELMFPAGQDLQHQRPYRAHLKSRLHDGFSPMTAQAGRWDVQVISSFSISPECSPNVYLLVFITSSPDHFAKREAVRTSWCHPNFGSIANVPLAPEVTHVQCVFLIGQSKNREVQEKVTQEAQKTKDILYGTYEDSYKNLTLKVLSGFHWSSLHCDSQYVFKTDDDCYANTITLVKFLSLQDGALTNFYAGRIASRERETGVVRNPESQWSVSRQEYMPDTFPKYASGSGYILSWDVFEKIVAESKMYPPFPNEDAYIGVLAEQIGATPKHSERFTFYKNQWSLCNFLYMFVTHEVEVNSHGKMYNLTLQAYQKCHENFITAL